MGPQPFIRHLVDGGAAGVLTLFSRRLQRHPILSNPNHIWFSTPWSLLHSASRPLLQKKSHSSNLKSTKLPKPQHHPQQPAQAVQNNWRYFRPSTIRLLLNHLPCSSSGMQSFKPFASQSASSSGSTPSFPTMPRP